MIDDPDQWIKKTRRNNALRVLVAGVVVAIAGIYLLIAHRDWSGKRFLPLGRATSSDPRVVGGAIGVVGALLVITGLVMLTRSSRAPVARDDD